MGGTLGRLKPPLARITDRHRHTPRSATTSYPSPSGLTEVTVVSGSPGLYVIGLNFLRRRKSSFIHGAEDDARDLVDHLAAYLDARVPVGVG